MRKLYLVLIPTALWMSSGCTKSISSEENAAKKQADAFKASITTHKYTPVAFYSDKPIDYITTDNVVKSETDLWIYVKDYIKDDVNLFNDNGTVTVYQNAVKFPGNNAATLTENYSVSVNGTDVMFTFVDYNYVPTTYRLQEFNDAYFIVYVDGPSGSKLFSKFARVQ
jgi:hypothetical protein